VISSVKIIIEYLADKVSWMGLVQMGTKSVLNHLYKLKDAFKGFTKANDRIKKCDDGKSLFTVSFEYDLSLVVLTFL
jgi:hypothetical protein